VLLIVTASCATNPATYAAKGRKALDAGRLAEAEIDYLKAVQAKPEYGEAWFGLGLTESREAKLADAYDKLTHAAQLLPSRDDVAISLADICVAIYVSGSTRPEQVYNEVVTTYSNLLRRNPNSYDGLRLKGYVAMIDRHYPEAVDLLRRANAVKPGQGDVTQALMESLIGNDQGAEAEKLGEDFLSRRKDFAAVYNTLYAYLMKNHREGEAGDLLKAKVAANPDVADYRIQLAQHDLNVGKTAEMAAVLQELVDDPKRFPDGRMLAGNFCAAGNRLDDALAYFQAGAQQDRQRKIAYQQRAAEVLVSMHRPDLALTTLGDILKTDPENVDARALRSAINLDSNQPDLVQAAFLELPQLLKLRPKDATLHFNLGRAYLARGNADAALSEFQEAIRQDPRFVAPRVLAARVSMAREDYAQANQYGEQITQLTGGAGARLLQAEALTGMGKFEEAGRQIARLQKDYPDAPEPKLQLAALKLAEKNYTEAETLYRSIYEGNRKDLRSLDGLVQTLMAANREDAAIQLLTQENQKSPSPQIDSMLADTALRGNKLDLAIQQYSKMSNAQPNSSFDHLRLGDAWLRKGDMEQAIAQFRTARNLAPKDAMANAMLALALNNAGQTEEAQRMYRETLTLQSGNPLVANNLAYLMAENGGNLDEALNMAQGALRSQPSNAAIADTVGVIYLKKHLADSAIQVLTTATRKDPKEPMYHYHLAMALVQKGDKAAARHECEAALAGQPTKSDEQKIRTLIATLT
jgi:tetratricopeptide (TPR) repeat protein